MFVTPARSKTEDAVECGCNNSSTESDRQEPSWESAWNHSKSCNSVYYEENELIRGCKNATHNANKPHQENRKSCESQAVQIFDECTTTIDLPPIFWHGYNNEPKFLSISNTSRNILINGQWPNGKPFIEGGPLNGSYMFSQIHFHCPSEHEIRGRRYPLEMHVVHYKSCYLTQERAMEEKDGTVVLVYLFEVNNDSNTILSYFTKRCPPIQKLNNPLEVAGFALSYLIAPFHSNYYVYWGSISTEKNSYILQWIINCTNLYATKEEVNELFNLMDSGEPCDGKRKHLMKPVNNAVYYVGNVCTTAARSQTTHHCTHSQSTVQFETPTHTPHHAPSTPQSTQTHKCIRGNLSGLYINSQEIRTSKKKKKEQHERNRSNETFTIERKPETCDKGVMVTPIHSCESLHPTHEKTKQTKKKNNREVAEKPPETSQPPKESEKNQKANEAEKCASVKVCSKTDIISEMKGFVCEIREKQRKRHKSDSKSKGLKLKDKKKCDSKEKSKMSVKEEKKRKKKKNEENCETTTEQKGNDKLEEKCSTKSIQKESKKKEKFFLLSKARNKSKSKAKEKCPEPEEITITCEKKEKEKEKEKCIESAPVDTDRTINFLLTPTFHPSTPSFQLTTSEAEAVSNLANYEKEKIFEAPEKIMNNSYPSNNIQPVEAKESFPEFLLQTEHLFRAENGKNFALCLSQDYTVTIIYNQNILQEFKGTFSPNKLEPGNYEKFTLTPKYPDPENVIVHLEECSVKMETLDQLYIRAKFMLKKLKLNPGQGIDNDFFEEPCESGRLINPETKTKITVTEPINNSNSEFCRLMTLVKLENPNSVHQVIDEEPKKSEEKLNLETSPPKKEELSIEFLKDPSKDLDICRSILSEFASVSSAAQIEDVKSQQYLFYKSNEHLKNQKSLIEKSNEIIKNLIGLSEKSNETLKNLISLSEKSNEALKSQRTFTKKSEEISNCQIVSDDSDKTLKSLFSIHKKTVHFTHEKPKKDENAANEIIAENLKTNDEITKPSQEIRFSENEEPYFATDRSIANEDSFQSGLGSRELVSQILSPASSPEPPEQKTQPLPKTETPEKIDNEKDLVVLHEYNPKTFKSAHIKSERKVSTVQEIEKSDASFQKSEKSDKSKMGSVTVKIEKSSNAKDSHFAQIILPVELTSKKGKKANIEVILLQDSDSSDSKNSKKEKEKEYIPCLNYFD